MFKKLTICLLAVLGSASALAAHGDDMTLPTASGVNLMAPHQEGSWSFGAQANYFEPNYDFNYAYSIDQAQQDPDVFNNSTRSVDPDYEGGWGVDVTYHFPGEGRDVTASFTQLHTSESDSASTLDHDSPDYFSGTGAIFAGTDVVPDHQNSFDTVSAHVDADYDAVDLTFGQLITIGDRITLHPFAGGRYADIDYKATASYASHFLSTSGTTSQQEEDLAGQTFKSEFQGVGPRLGSDAAVNLGGGFSLGATLGVSLLVGDMDNSYTAYYASGSTPPAASDYSYHNFDTHNDTRVVPEADAKVNAKYHADFNNGYGMGFEVGYQVTNYWDVIDSSTDNFYDTTDHHDNFSMQGPYARIQLDVA